MEEQAASQKKKDETEIAQVVYSAILTAIYALLPMPNGFDPNERFGLLRECFPPELRASKLLSNPSPPSEILIRKTNLSDALFIQTDKALPDLPFAMEMVDLKRLQRDVSTIYSVSQQIGIDDTLCGLNGTRWSQIVDRQASGTYKAEIEKLSEMILGTAIEDKRFLSFSTSKIPENMVNSEEKEKWIFLHKSNVQLYDGLVLQQIPFQNMIYRRLRGNGLEGASRPSFPMCLNSGITNISNSDIQKYKNLMIPIITSILEVLFSLPTSRLPPLSHMNDHYQTLLVQAFPQGAANITSDDKLRLLSYQTDFLKAVSFVNPTKFPLIQGHLQALSTRKPEVKKKEPMTAQPSLIGRAFTWMKIAPEPQTPEEVSETLICTIKDPSEVFADDLKVAIRESPWYYVMTLLPSLTTFKQMMFKSPESQSWFAVIGFMASFVSLSLDVRNRFDLRSELLIDDYKSHLEQKIMNAFSLSNIKKHLKGSSNGIKDNFIKQNTQLQKIQTERMLMEKVEELVLEINQRFLNVRTLSRERGIDDILFAKFVTDFVVSAKESMTLLLSMPADQFRLNLANQIIVQTRFILKLLPNAPKWFDLRSVLFSIRNHFLRMVKRDDEVNEEVRRAIEKHKSSVYDWQALISFAVAPEPTKRPLVMPVVSELVTATTTTAAIIPQTEEEMEVVEIEPRHIVSNANQPAAVAPLSPAESKQRALPVELPIEPEPQSAMNVVQPEPEPIAIPAQMIPTPIAQQHPPLEPEPVILPSPLPVLTHSLPVAAPVATLVPAPVVSPVVTPVPTSIEQPAPLESSIPVSTLVPVPVSIPAPVQIQVPKKPVVKETKKLVPSPKKTSVKQTETPTVEQNPKQVVQPPPKPVVQKSIPSPLPVPISTLVPAPSTPVQTPKKPPSVFPSAVLTLKKKKPLVAPVPSAVAQPLSPQQAPTLEDLLPQDFNTLSHGDKLAATELALAISKEDNLARQMNFDPMWLEKEQPADKIGTVKTVSNGPVPPAKPPTSSFPVATSTSFTSVSTTSAIQDIFTSELESDFDLGGMLDPSSQEWGPRPNVKFPSKKRGRAVVESSEEESDTELQEPPSKRPDTGKKKEALEAEKKGTPKIPEPKPFQKKKIGTKEVSSDEDSGSDEERDKDEAMDIEESPPRRSFGKKFVSIEESDEEEQGEDDGEDEEEEATEEVATGKISVNLRYSILRSKWTRTLRVPSADINYYKATTLPAPDLAYLAIFRQIEAHNRSVVNQQDRVLLIPPQLTKDLKTWFMDMDIDRLPRMIDNVMAVFWPIVPEQFEGDLKAKTQAARKCYKTLRQLAMWRKFAQNFALISDWEGERNNVAKGYHNYQFGLLVGYSGPTETPKSDEEEEEENPPSIATPTSTAKPKSKKPKPPPLPTPEKPKPYVLSCYQDRREIGGYWEHNQSEFFDSTTKKKTKSNAKDKTVAEPVGYHALFPLFVARVLALTWHLENPALQEEAVKLKQRNLPEILTPRRMTDEAIDFKEIKPDDEFIELTYNSVVQEEESFMAIMKEKGMDVEVFLRSKSINGEPVLSSMLTSLKSFYVSSVYLDKILANGPVGIEKTDIATETIVKLYESITGDLETPLNVQKTRLSSLVRLPSVATPQAELANVTVLLYTATTELTSIINDDSLYGVTDNFYDTEFKISGKTMENEELVEAMNRHNRRDESLVIYEAVKGTIPSDILRGYLLDIVDFPERLEGMKKVEKAHKRPEVYEGEAMEVEEQTKEAALTLSEHRIWIGPILDLTVISALQSDANRVQYIQGMIGNIEAYIKPPRFIVFLVILENTPVQLFVFSVNVNVKAKTSTWLSLIQLRFIDDARINNGIDWIGLFTFNVLNHSRLVGLPADSNLSQEEFANRRVSFDITNASGILTAGTLVRILIINTGGYQIKGFDFANGYLYEALKMNFAQHLGVTLNGPNDLSGYRTRECKSFVDFLYTIRNGELGPAADKEDRKYMTDLSTRYLVAEKTTGKPPKAAKPSQPRIPREKRPSITEQASNLIKKYDWTKASFDLEFIYPATGAFKAFNQKDWNSAFLDRPFESSIAKRFGGLFNEPIFDNAVQELFWTARSQDAKNTRKVESTMFISSGVTRTACFPVNTIKEFRVLIADIIGSEEISKKKKSKSAEAPSISTALKLNETKISEHLRQLLGFYEQTASTESDIYLPTEVASDHIIRRLNLLEYDTLIFPEYNVIADKKNEKDHRVMVLYVVQNLATYLVSPESTALYITIIDPSIPHYYDPPEANAKRRRFGVTHSEFWIKRAKRYIPSYLRFLYLSHQTTTGAPIRLSKPPKNALHNISYVNLPENLFPMTNDQILLTPVPSDIATTAITSATTIPVENVAPGVLNPEKDKERIIAFRKLHQDDFEEYKSDLSACWCLVILRMVFVNEDKEKSQANLERFKLFRPANLTPVDAPIQQQWVKEFVAKLKEDAADLLPTSESNTAEEMFNSLKRIFDSLKTEQLGLDLDETVLVTEVFQRGYAHSGSVELFRAIAKQLLLPPPSERKKKAPKKASSSTVPDAPPVEPSDPDEMKDIAEINEEKNEKEIEEKGEESGEEEEEEGKEEEGGGEEAGEEENGDSTDDEMKTD